MFQLLLGASIGVIIALAGVGIKEKITDGDVPVVPMAVSEEEIKPIPMRSK